MKIYICSVYEFDVVRKIIEISQFCEDDSRLLIDSCQFHFETVTRLLQCFIKLAYVSTNFFVYT